MDRWGSGPVLLWVEAFGLFRSVASSSSNQDLGCMEPEGSGEEDELVTHQYNLYKTHIGGQKHTYRRTEAQCTTGDPPAV